MHWRMERLRIRQQESGKMDKGISEAAESGIPIIYSMPVVAAYYIRSGKKQ